MLLSLLSVTVAFNPAELILDSESYGISESVESQLTPIKSELLQEKITAKALEKWAHKLYVAANASTETEGNPTRAVGTKGFEATIELIVNQLDKLKDYYTYEVQPFVVSRSTIHSWNVTHNNGQNVDAKPFKMCPGGKADNAPIHFIENEGCLPSDYYGSNGSVAVVASGKCGFGEKAEFAGLAGAAALLIWDPNLKNRSEVKYGTLGTPTENQAQTLGISIDFAEKLLKEGDALSVYVDAEVDNVDTVNVIAETRGGDHDNVVFSGAHSDSVTVGPGINDNGSGFLAQLEVAKQLANFKVNNAVRFAWWAAEENGLKGSLHYVENLTKREAAKIRLFLDYDVLGSRNWIYEIYDSDDSENPVGSSALRDMFREWYDSHGCNYTLQPFDGRSDYVGFVDIGIPASGVDSGVEEIKTEKEVLDFGGKSGEAFDPCYHLECDDLINVDYEPWLVNAKLVAHSVSKYAESLEGFPVRDSSFYEQRDPKPHKWSRGNSDLNFI